MGGPSKSPGLSLAAQLRAARAAMKRAARKNAEKDLQEAKDRSRAAELKAHKAAIRKRGKESNR